MLCALKAGCRPGRVPRGLLLLLAESACSSSAIQTDQLHGTDKLACRKLDAGEFMEPSQQSLLGELKDSFLVYENFISPAEENSLFAEVHRKLKKMRYQYDHWDNAIVGYREYENREWSKDNDVIINRVRSLAFAANQTQMSLVHVLDLDEQGHIKAHIDSVKFCGDVIAGMSLLSSCVMKLCHDKDPDLSVKCLLPKRSLYIMKHTARYDYSHEVLKNEESIFKGQEVKKGRRISVICRSEV